MTMVDEAAFNALDIDERKRLKRKLYDADFESVESLKGLDLNSDKPENMVAFDETASRKSYTVNPSCLYNNRDNNICQATRPREIAEGTKARTRSISLTQGPSREGLHVPKKLPTVFKWERGGKKIYISGSFDNWQSKTELSKSHGGDFCTIIELPQGTHQYKFQVDGQWVCDPTEPKVDNGMSSENNIVVVRNSDFEVFEALAMDSASTGHSKTGIAHSPPGDYGHNIPPRTQGLGYHSGPPILPPHLLQVILNKEIPMHCEPTLLPEPNHVMLNHLYALSIKDGVMVLSSTHRYRKKYVTTLLYKPT